MPPTLGARYALRLTVAGQKRWSWVTTPAAPAPSTPAPASFCGPGPIYRAFQAEIRPSVTTVHPGDTLAYTVVNTADGPVQVSSGGALVPSGGTPAFQVADTPIAGGATLDRTLTVPADAQSGSYRLVHEFEYGQCDLIVIGHVTTPIEVVTAA